MAPSNQEDSYPLQEPKTRLFSGLTGPRIAADTPPYREPQPVDHKLEPGVNDHYYSGLQVVETGLEVVPPCLLPEALPPQHQQQVQYLEYKPWAAAGHSPPPLQQQQQRQLPPPHPGYAQPGSTTTSLPYYAGGGVVPDYRYHDGHNNNFPELPGNAAGGGRGGRVCGLRRVVFWAVLAVVVFAAVAAVAIGVGVGLGTRGGAPAASTTPTTAPTATINLPAATATSTTAPYLSIVCPSANRTVYSLAGSSSGQKFLVLCGRDYNSCCGAQDMVSVNTTTFEGCLEECGSQEGCVAVGWGNYYGTNTCWLKSAVGEPNWSEGWYSAVLE